MAHQHMHALYQPDTHHGYGAKSRSPSYLLPMMPWHSWPTSSWRTRRHPALQEGVWGQGTSKGWGPTRHRGARRVSNWNFSV